MRKYLNESINPDDYFYIGKDGEHYTKTTKYEKMRERQKKAMENYKRKYGNPSDLWGDDWKRFKQFERRQERTMKKALQDDDFLRGAIFYELWNCEYQHSPFCKVRPLHGLGLTPDDYYDDERLKRIFDEAEDLLWDYVCRTDPEFGCMDED